MSAQQATLICTEPSRRADKRIRAAMAFDLAAPLRRRRRAARTMITLFAGILAFAWLLFTPNNSLALTPAEARHLLERTGFGINQRDIALFEKMSRAEAVDYLLATLDAPWYTRPPPFVRQPYPNYRAEDWMRQEVVFWRINEIQQLQSWWLQEMIMTPTPFADRLTLFWHGHFVSRFDNTHISAPFFDQLELFRTEGSRSFRSLTRRILVDPMMLSGLDNIYNTRKHPNENLARELLELFTLGIGRYSEDDIKQVARVLAGHGVDVANGWRYRFDPSAAVPGEKTILGRRIGGDSADELDRLVDILLERPETAKRLAAKFYAEFVSVEDDPQEIDRLARLLYQNDYAIKPFLRNLLLSPAFWDEKHRGSLVKSPLDLVVGFSRTFALTLPDYQLLVDYLYALGQQPFMAPSVAGWPTGNRWLDSKQLVNRERVLGRLWQAVENPLAQEPDALYIRFASEHKGLPVRFHVEADHQRVATLTARLGVDTRQELGSSEPGNLKPMWETATIPRSRLPPAPESVTLTLDAEAPGANLFVNWIALGEQRFSPRQARWIIPEGSHCRADSPPGSFYCNLALHFDLRQAVDAGQASLDDRQAPLNSNIEYGTGRLPTRLAGAAAMAPAGRQVDYLNQLSPYILATAPMLIQQPPARPAGREWLKALTLDPAYNLK